MAIYHPCNVCASNSTAATTTTIMTATSISTQTQTDIDTDTDTDTNTNTTRLLQQRDEMSLIVDDSKEAEEHYTIQTFPTRSSSHYSSNYTTTSMSTSSSPSTVQSPPHPNHNHTATVYPSTLYTLSHDASINETECDNMDRMIDINLQQDTHTHTHTNHHPVLTIDTLSYTPLPLSTQTSPLHPQSYHHHHHHHPPHTNRDTSHENDNHHHHHHNDGNHMNDIHNPTPHSHHSPKQPSPSSPPPTTSKYPHTDTDTHISSIHPHPPLHIHVTTPTASAPHTSTMNTPTYSQRYSFTRSYKDSMSHNQVHSIQIELQEMNSNHQTTHSSDILNGTTTTTTDTSTDTQSHSQVHPSIPLQCTQPFHFTPFYYALPRLYDTSTLVIAFGILLSYVIATSIAVSVCWNEIFYSIDSIVESDTTIVNSSNNESPSSSSSLPQCTSHDNTIRSMCMMGIFTICTTLIIFLSIDILQRIHIYQRMKRWFQRVILHRNDETTTLPSDESPSSGCMKQATMSTLFNVLHVFLPLTTSASSFTVMIMILSKITTECRTSQMIPFNYIFLSSLFLAGISISVFIYSYLTLLSMSRSRREKEYQELLQRATLMYVYYIPTQIYIIPPATPKDDEDAGEDQHVSERNVHHIMSERREVTDMSSGLSERQLSSTGPSSNGDLDCCICLTSFKHYDEVITLECTHMYHADCCKQWLMKKPSGPSCAMCRQTITLPHDIVERYQQWLKQLQQEKQQQQKSHRNTIHPSNCSLPPVDTTTTSSASVSTSQNHTTQCI